MKRFKKSLLGFLKYFGTMLVSIVCVVAIMVVNFMLTKDASEEQAAPIGSKSETAIEKILNNLEQMEDGQFDLCLHIEHPEMEDIKIETSIGVVTHKAETKVVTTSEVEENDSLSIDVVGAATLGEEEIPFNLTYVGSTLYANFSGVLLKLQTTNFIESIENIMKLNLLGGLDFNISLSSLNWETIKGMIIGFGSQAKTEEIETGLKTNLDVMGFGTISFLTDVDYNLNQLQINDFEFEGIKINGVVDSKVNTGDLKPIIKPSYAEYATDLTNIDDFLKTVDNLVEKGKMSGTATVNINNNIMDMLYSISFEDNSIEMYVETFIASQKLIVRFIENKVYVAFDDLKYYFDLDNFDFNRVFENVKGCMKLLGYNFENLDLNSVAILDEKSILGILTQIRDIKLDDEGISLYIEKGMLAIKAENNLFTEIQFVYPEILTMKASLDEEIKEEDFDKEEYFNIEKLGNTINNLKTQITTKKFATQITFNVNESEYSAKLYLDLQEDLKAKISTTFDNNDIEIIYKDMTIFVCVNDFKFKYKVPDDLDVNELLNTTAKLIQEFIPNFSFERINEEVISETISNIDKNVTEDAVNFTIINASTDCLDVEIKGIKFTLLMNDGEVGSILFENEGGKILFDIISNDFEISETGKHIEINDALEYVPAIINLVNSKKISISTTINVNNINIKVDAKVDFTNGVQVQAIIHVFDEKIELFVKDENIYLEYRNIKTQATLEELLDLISDNSIINNTDNVQSAIHINDILSDITSEKGLLNIILTQGLIVSLEKEGNELVGINILYDDSSLALEISTFDEDLYYEESGEYQSITELVDFTKIILDFVQNETIAFELSTKIEEFDIIGKIMFEEQKITAYLETEISNRKLLVIYKNDKIYIDFDGLRLTCAVDNIDDLIDYIAEFAEIEISIDPAENAIDYNDILNSLFVKIKDDIFNVFVDEAAITIDTQNNKLNNIVLNYNSYKLIATPCEKFDLKLEKNYIDLYEIRGLSKAVYNTLKNLSVSGSIEITIEMFGEPNPISVDYSIGFIDNRLIGYIYTNFKGLDVNVYLDGEDIYIYVVGLKIHFNINEREELVAWINKTFDTNLSLDFIDDALESMEDTTLDFVSSIVSKDGFTFVTLRNGLLLTVVYDEYVRSVIFEHENSDAIITCTDFDFINLDNLDKEEYKDWEEFTGMIENFYNVAMSSQFDLRADVNIFEIGKTTQTLGADLQIDVAEGLDAYVNLTGLGEQIQMYYEDKALYFKYAGENGIKLSIQEKSIQEILAIALNALGVDTSTIPYLDEFLQKENIDTSNLETVLPKIELGNPLVYLEYIDSFHVSDTCFTIKIKAEKLPNQESDQNVEIKINYTNSKIKSIELKDLFVSETQKINAIIKLNEFSKVRTEAVKDDYIDISGSSDLLKALVNTSYLNDYHINGKINMNFNVNDNAVSLAAVGVDARIKREKVIVKYVDEVTGEIVEEEKNELTGIITLDNYPLIGGISNAGLLFEGINNGNTNGSVSIPSYLAGNKRLRKITIVLKDGYAYLRTLDEEYKDYEQLQRATKVTTDYLINNIMYYVQYLLGFTDTIQTEIEKAIEESQKNTEVDYGQIILDYTHVGRCHNIVLNMAQIAKNQDIGTMSIKLTTINNEATQNKDYLYRLDLNLQLLDNMMSITTDESSDKNALFLIDIGKEVSMQDLKDFVTEYDDAYKFGIDGEYEKVGGKAWTQANTGDVTITFYSQGEVYLETSGGIATTLNLPIPERIEDNGTTQKTYTFEGWYTDESFTTKYTANSYPRYSIPLYAKWSEPSVKKYVTVRFVTNEDSITENEKIDLEGAPLDLPIYSNIEETIDDNISKLKIFQGWYTDEACTNKFTSTIFPSENITLYALWKEETAASYDLTIYFDENVVYSGRVPGDVEFAFPVKDCFKDTTKYFDFETGKEITDFVVTENATWVAKNYYNVKVSSLYTETENSYSYSESMLNGSILTLPTFTKAVEDHGTYFTEYTLLGYYVNGDTNNLISAGTKISIPANDVTYVAQWDVSEYCYVYFDTTWVKPSAWGNDNTKKHTQLSAPTPIERVKVKRYSAFNADNYIKASTAKYNYTVYVYVIFAGYKPVSSADYSFFVAGWNTESNKCLFTTTPTELEGGGREASTSNPSLTITQHTTLHAEWDATMKMV